MILIINWFLALLALATAGHAAWKLWRKPDKPLTSAISAILTCFFFMMVITMWNTNIPVWLWWITAALLGLVGGLATFRVLGDGPARSV